MTRADLTSLAALVSFGVATPKETEEFWKGTMDTARISIAKTDTGKTLTKEDREDALMVAVEKAWRCLARYDCRRAKWETYVSLIARGVAFKSLKKAGERACFDNLEDHHEL